MNSTPHPLPAARGLKICVIDDQLLVVLSIRRLLEDQGHHVTSCANPIMALKIMEQDVPDLVLLDYRMPEMNGEDVLNEMKVHPTLKEVPVIVITGELKPNVERALTLKGVREIILKPYTRESLLRSLAKLEASRNGDA